MIASAVCKKIGDNGKSSSYDNRLKHEITSFHLQETPAHFLSLASLSLTSGAAVYASINIACLACATMAPGGRSSGTTTALVSFLAQSEWGRGAWHGEQLDL